MRNACWIPKSTNTNSEYVILITFPSATMVAWMHLHVTLYLHCSVVLRIVRSTQELLHSTSQMRRLNVKASDIHELSFTWLIDVTTDQEDSRYADNSINQFVYNKLKLLRHHEVHTPDVWSRCATDIPHETSAILLAVVPDTKCRVMNGTNRRLNVIAIMSKI
jgi:hypothetical protein